MYSKLFNPELREAHLVANGVEVKIPSRSFVVVEHRIAEAAHQMMVALEHTPATEAEYEAFSNPPKAEQPKPEKPKRKKGAK